MLSRLTLNPAGGSGNAGLSSGPNTIAPPNPPPRAAPGAAPCGACWAAATRIAVNEATHNAGFIISSLLAQRLLDRGRYDGCHELVAVGIRMQAVAGQPVLQPTLVIHERGEVIHVDRAHLLGIALHPGVELHDVGGRPADGHPLPHHHSSSGSSA